MTYRKKLIEVALPLDAINRESAREKEPFTRNHPRSLHIWWARRPLAACRAVLFSSLVDDPSSDPQYRRADGSVDEEAAAAKRAQLFNLIEELVKWENSNNDTIINAARAEIARCVASRKLELGELKRDAVIWPGVGSDEGAGNGDQESGNGPEKRRAGRSARVTAEAANPQSEIRNPQSPAAVTVWDLVVKGHGDLDAIRSGRWRLPNPEAVNAFLAEHAPPVLDPFCGGGSIPLEAQRLGLRAFASDLNPVAVLITKALIEIPPKFAGRPPVNPDWQSKSPEEKAAKVWRGAQGLAEDVRYYGKWMRDEAEKRIGHLYPKVNITAEMVYGSPSPSQGEGRGEGRKREPIRPDLVPYIGQELTVIAWLWARTVPSPNPALGGAHVPLVRSSWLSTKKGKEAWVEPVVVQASSLQSSGREAGRMPAPQYRFEVRVGTPPKTFDPKKGTVERTGARCLLSNQPVPFDHIRAEGKAGRMSDRLLAVVAEGTKGRVYLTPTDEHETLARSAKPKNYPDTPLPEKALSFRVMLYGMDRHYKLFTPRQLVALTTFSDLEMEARERVLADARLAADACGAGFQPAASIEPCTRRPASSPGAARMAAPQDYEFVDPRTTPFVTPASRGELPHLYKEAGTYFVTFRLHDAVVPAASTAQAGSLHHKQVKVDHVELARRYAPPLTLGSCALRRPEIAGLVRDALLHFACGAGFCGAGFQPASGKRERSEDGCTAMAGGTLAPQDRYHLLAWSIMPNHVHVIFAPIGEHTPSDTLHSWKSFTSKEANKILGRTGTFWERESFDHLIRSAEDLERFVTYVEHNPVLAGLCERPEQWPWSSCGAACGAGVSPAGSQRGRLEACATNQPDVAYADAVATYLAFAQSKACNHNTSLCIWETSMDRLVATFGRQALPMVWDFAETNPLAGAGGDLYGTVVSVCEVLDKSPSGIAGMVEQHDAATPRSSPQSLMIATDPPYYDNIDYADLADFFYIWLRRSMGTLYPALFRTLVTPKAEELIPTPYRHEGSKAKAMSFFETGLARAFERMREVEHPDYPLTVYYAFKQSETDENNSDEADAVGATASTGWETMLEGLILAGFSITATWPMRTEQPKGLRAHEQKALASSIILVCHPRAVDAAMTTRKDFVAALKKELPAALRDLQSGNIAPVDLAQAAIGPGMAIYSRHSKVVSTDGSRMSVRTALQLINQALDEVLSELESEFDSPTRWAIKWFEQHAHDEGAFGDAETLSKAMAVAVSGPKEASLIKSGQGKVRLLRRDELVVQASSLHGKKAGAGQRPAPQWDPATDKRLTIWEVTQYLIRRLESGGDAAAAELLRKVGSLGEVARDLAYRLYSTCERKKWAEEARSYNGLVVAWPEIVRMSRKVERTSTQTEIAFE